MFSKRLGHGKNKAGCLMKNQFSCYIIGETSLSVQCADILLQRGHCVHGIISPHVPIIEKWAAEKGISHLTPDLDLAGLLGRQPFDYFFCIVYSHVIPENLLDLPEKAAVNWHDGPLPRYAGMHATSWAIMNQEKEHAVTWHLMTAGIDEGDIIKQRSVGIDEKDTAFSLNMKCYEAAIQSFGEMVAEIENDTIHPGAQNLENRTYFSKYLRPPGACAIDWGGKADEIDAFVRTLNFGSHHENPLGFPKMRIGNEMYFVPHVDICKTGREAEPGTIVTFDAESLKVATSENGVAITTLLDSNGDRRTIRNIKEMFRLQEGDRLPSLDAERQDRLTELNAEICRYEAFWVRKLSGWKPVDVPFAEHDAFGCVEPRCRTVPMLIPGEYLRPDDGTSRAECLIAALGVFLARISSDYSYFLTFSYPALRRRLAGFESHFLPIVPLHVEIEPSGNISEALAKVVGEIVMAKRRVSYACDTLLRFPALDHVRAQYPSGLSSLHVEILETFEGYVPPLRNTLSILLLPDGNECRWVYNENCFQTANIESMQQQIAVFLEYMTGHPNAAVSRVPLLSGAGYRQIVHDWNDTAVEYPQDRLIHQVFEAQAERAPDAVAVVYEGKQLTYRELNRRANQLAHWLQSRGVGPETPVGVVLERSLEMVVALYGVLKAGGAYVPLDPTYPAERLVYMLEETALPVLLTQSKLRHRLPEFKGDVICLDTQWDSLVGHRNVENPVGRARLDNLAYIIYTSGSTGQPKGVMNTHGGILNRLLWMQDAYCLTDSDRVLQKTPFSFDVSVWEFFWPLMFGARLVVARPEGHKDSEYLVETIVDQQITVIHFVPSMLQLFLEARNLERCQSLRHVVCSGEALSVDLQNRFFDRLNAKLHNLYGPTEAAVDVTCWECQNRSDLRTVPIGRPVANTQLYILDRGMNPVPIGVPGELHIGGAQVARGYVNRPDLTEERFVRDPFSQSPNARLYKTGDLARYLSDGNIEFLGRLDHQVKIRGLRIELGEIESVLTRHPAVRDAVVLAREDPSGDKRLVAYMVCAFPSPPDTRELRDHLKRDLPDYMVPTIFVWMDALPLTGSGKIDRRSLPAPEGQRRSTAVYRPPAGGLQKTIAEVWAGLLQVEQVGIDDNFFDLGGHSLLIMQAHQRLCEISDKPLSVADMFRFPTVAALAQHLSQSVGYDEMRAHVAAGKSEDRANARRAAIRRQRDRRQRRLRGPISESQQHVI